MIRMSLAGVRFLVKRFNAHLLHHRADVLATNFEGHSIKLVTQHPGSHEWVFQVQFIYLAHERQIFLTERFGLIVRTASAYLK